MPLDLMGDKMLIELKTGLSSVGKSAQQWRTTFSTSPAEKKLLKKMSPARRTEFYAKKQQEAYDRKGQAHKDIEMAVGQKLSAHTMGVILNHDKGLADLFMIPGYHQRVGWNQEQTKKGYMGTVKYR
jgi:hypothetical protein